MAALAPAPRFASSMRTVAIAVYLGSTRRAATTAAATASPTHTTMIHALRAIVAHARRRSISWFGSANGDWGCSAGRLSTIAA